MEHFTPHINEKPLEKSHTELVVQELEKMKAISNGDVEIFHHLVNKKIAELIEKKKEGLLTMAQLIEQRKIFDDSIPFENLSNFKQKELIDNFMFEGNEVDREEIIEYIKDKESIAEHGLNQKGVFELPGNRIVKVVSLGNYPYEVPMVSLTRDLDEGNVIKTYDVFKNESAVYVVQDKAVGKDLHNYTAAELEAIPQEQYDDLVKLVNMYASHGIATDPSKISNLFYDTEKGFTAIDLGAATYQRGLEYHIAAYFTDSLSKEKIEKAIEKYGQYQLKPITVPLKERITKVLN